MAANQKGVNQSCGEISKICTDDFLDLEYARWKEMVFDYRLTIYTAQPPFLIRTVGY